MQTLKPSELVLALRECIESQTPVCVWGTPGIGKSQIMQQLATATERTLYDVRAATLDAVDLRGIPYVDGGRTKWATPSFLPYTSGALVNYDELNRAPVMVMNGLLQLIQERRCGDYALPADAVQVACCNYETDGGGVQKMTGALANRFLHLHLVTDVTDWIKWAIGAGLEFPIIAFMGFRPELLNTFNAKEKANATPRTWERMSGIVKRQAPANIEHALFSGCVGESTAQEFSAFVRDFRQLPNIQAVFMNPQAAILPTSPSAMYAISAAVARTITPSNCGRGIQYLDRLPAEYGVYSLRLACAVSPAIQSTPEFIAWGIAHSDVVF